LQVIAATKASSTIASNITISYRNSSSFFHIIE
jgi:hypothetical protein